MYKQAAKLEELDEKLLLQLKVSLLLCFEKKMMREK
jgi:hypothetical protein